MFANSRLKGIDHFCSGTNRSDRTIQFAYVLHSLQFRKMLLKSGATDAQIYRFATRLLNGLRYSLPSGWFLTSVGPLEGSFGGIEGQAIPSEAPFEGEDCFRCQPLQTGSHRATGPLGIASREPDEGAFAHN